jgi:hypothetical protein
MLKASAVINSKEDVELFISNNKSKNCNIQKEEFQKFNPAEMNQKFRH